VVISETPVLKNIPVPHSKNKTVKRNNPWTIKDFL